MATTTTPEQDDSDWGKGYHELQSFVAAHGHARVPARHVTAAGFRLGAWVTRQRADHLGQQLGMPHAGKLEALSGWAWNKSDADWDAQYEKLSAYASEHEHAQPPIDYSTADAVHRHQPTTPACRRYVATR